MRISLRTPLAAKATVARKIGLPLLAVTLLVACSPNEPLPPLEEQIERLREIQPRHEDNILALPGVFGIGIGLDDDGERAIFHVYVDEEKSVPNLPADIEQVPTKVFRRSLPRLLDCASTGACHADQQNTPVQMGNSTDTVLDCSGCTLGFKACDIDRGKMVYVTNSHCTADASGFAGSAPIGTNTRHVGGLDVSPQCPGMGGAFPGGGQGSGSGIVNIGTVSGHAAPSCTLPLFNSTDASKIDSDSSLTSLKIRDIDFPAGEGVPMPGMTVSKVGRSTGLTEGRIKSVGCKIDVPGPADGGFQCGPLPMTNQLLIETEDTFDFAEGGDSGSAVLDAQNRIVGLLWGGGGSIGWANPIDSVLVRLHLSLNLFSCFADCLFTSLASALPDPETAISLGHRFREQVFEKSPRGQRYTNIYYQVTDEAVRIVAANPGLLAHTAELFKKQRPMLEALLEGGSVEVSRTDLEAIDGLLVEYQKYGSPSLQTALEILRKDLQDSRVLAEFNVKIK